MKAEIIAIGSELVSGQALDTNSQWLSRALGDVGIPVRFHTAIGDDLAENLDAFRIAAHRADLVITSGGLGPTQDDLTREALAKLAGVELVEHAASLEAIAAMFARRNRPMAERNRVQALFPAGSEPLPNAVGTAPGIGMKVGGTLFACLPGVPHELKRMFTDQVLPWLQRSGVPLKVIAHRKINLFGRGESEVEALAMDLTVRGRVPEVGITASDATISFRLSAEAADEASARLLIEPIARVIHERFADLIVGEGSEDVADALARELDQAGKTIGIVDGFTCGVMTQMLGLVPNEANRFAGGFVLDPSGSIERLLGIGSPEEGPAIAAALASTARQRLGADLGLAAVGSKTAKAAANGTVFLGLATAEGVKTRTVELGSDQPREFLQRRAAKQALNWARLTLRGKDL
jgi:nicotinamide-nucleotide amidase